ncbi:MAG: OprO/OprP family phosphate-selective porin [Thermoanaerobaculia bacterium]
MKMWLGIPVVVALLAAPTVARAQTDAERIAELEKKVESLVREERERAAAEEKGRAAKGTTLRSVSDRGRLEWASADGETSFRLVGRIHVDGVAFGGSENRLANGATLRRVRIGYKVRVAKDWVSELDVDFAENTVSVKDAWLGYTGFARSLVQVGHFKVPFGMDTLTSSNDTWFVERAYVDSWSPDRRLGLAYAWAGDRFSAKADLYAQTISVDAAGIDQGWGWAARGTWAPVRTPKGNAIHLGAAATWRRPDAGTAGFGEDPAYAVGLSSRPESTRASRAKFLDTSALVRTAWARQYAAELAGVWNAFAWQGEYQQTTVTRREGSAELADHEFHGWYGQLSFVLNGGRKYAPGAGLVERVSPGEGGAYEIVARYSTLDLNDPTEGDEVRGGSARNFTLGANWYPNASVRVLLNWTIVDNDEHARPQAAYGGLPGDDFSVYQVRFQFSL